MEKDPKINIVTVNTGWILQRTSERLAAKFPEIFTVSHEPTNSKDFDANFYMDITNCFHKKSEILDIGFFTHLHEGSMRYAPYQAILLDHVIHKSTRYFEAFKANNFPESKMSIGYPFEVPDTFRFKKPKIGVFQRGKHEGKGHHFLLEFFRRNIVKNFDWMFIGDGWQELVFKAAEKCVFIDHTTDGYLDYHDYPGLYHSCDYVLIPSLWEGGPISVIEANACGIPIIAPDVGWVNQSDEFLCEYPYRTGDADSLESVLYSLVETRIKKSNSVKNVNYTRFKDHIVSVINKLKGNV